LVWIIRPNERRNPLNQISGADKKGGLDDMVPLFLSLVVVEFIKIVMFRNGDGITSSIRRIDLGHIGSISNPKNLKIACYSTSFCDLRSGKDGLKL
jgi:hypothetical protein